VNYARKSNRKRLVSYHNQSWAFSCLRVLGAFCANIKKPLSYYKNVSRPSSALQKKFKNPLCLGGDYQKNPNHSRHRLGQVFPENRPLDRQATDFSHSQERRRYTCDKNFDRALSHCHWQSLQTLAYFCNIFTFFYKAITLSD
jgi:hypothetical protein